MPDIPETAKTLRPKISGLLGLFVLCAAFTALGTWMTLKKGDGLGWFGVAFFGLGMIVAVVIMLPNASYLRLEPQGFTMRSFYRSKFFQWSDVGPFGVGQVGMEKMVVFNFAPHYSRSRQIRRWASGLTGFEGGIPALYGLTAEDLADVMNQYREQYGGRQLQEP